MAYPDYIKTKVGPNLWHVDDCGYTYYQDRQGHIYNPCYNCGELTPERQLDDYENNCPKCWREAHSCYQCGEYCEKLHEGQDGHSYCDSCFIEYLLEQLQRRNNMDLNQFVKWQQEKPKTRHVNIEITYDETKIWVYDFALMVGQHVKSVEEIHLEGVREAREKVEYERLKAKFEGGTNCQQQNSDALTE